MPIPSVLSYTAAYFSLIIAVAVLLHDRHSAVHRLFSAGILLAATEEVLHGFGARALSAADVVYWQRWSVLVSVFTQGVWLAFCLLYARAAPALSRRAKAGVLAVCILPLLFMLVSPALLFGAGRFQAARWVIPIGWSGRILQLFFLIVSVCILFNLERTIRSSMGRIRWQIKFMVLGVAVLFGVRIYLASQALLFYSLDTRILGINALALITANVLFAFALSRGRSLNVDLYLSTATIETSLTVILAGIYLLAVGLLAHWTRYLQPESLPLDAFVVFAAVTSLAVVLFSNRLRRKLRLFVGRHFSRPVYDYRSAWMELTQRTTSILDANQLSNAVSRIVSESLDIHSVSVWLVDE
jgi:hypothetical protein